MPDVARRVGSLPAKTHGRLDLGGIGFTHQEGKRLGARLPSQNVRNWR